MAVDGLSAVGENASGIALWAEARGVSAIENRAAPEGAEAGGTFEQVLRRAVNDVRYADAQVETAALGVAAGSVANLHEVMLNLERARLSLELMVSLRNRALEAYQEITRIQV